MNGNISKKVPDPQIFASGYGKRKSDTLMEKFTEECSSCGLTIFDEEVSELGAYLDFLTRHVTTGKGCSVSCMMLWSEWAKFCKSQTRNYPVFLLEKEFRVPDTQPVQIPSRGRHICRDSIYGIAVRIGQKAIYRKFSASSDIDGISRHYLWIGADKKISLFTVSDITFFRVSSHFKCESFGKWSGFFFKNSKCGINGLNCRLVMLTAMVVPLFDLMVLYITILQK